MSSAPIRPQRVSKVPLDLELIPPSPILRPSQSWTSGEIPFFLDTPPSNETLPAMDSLASMFSLQSAVGSVGTFGQPASQQAQYPGNPSPRRVSVNERRGLDSSSSSSFQSFGSSLDILAEMCPTADPGASHSESSTPSTASFPLVEENEEYLSAAQRESVFTLSAYLGSASVYGDADDGTAGERVMHNTSIIGLSYSQESSPAVGYDIVPSHLKHTVNKQEHPQTLDVLSNDESAISSETRGRGMSVVDSKIRTSSSDSERDKSKIDVPLPSTSTFLASPLVSRHSEPPSLHSHLISESTPQSNHTQQQIKPLRVTSEPLDQTTHASFGPIDETFEGCNAMVENGRTTAVSPASQPVLERGAETSSSMRTANHTLRPRSKSNPHSQEMEIISKNRLSTSSSSAGISRAPAWLQATSIELWIDQEGFRSIQPRFELVEYSGKSGLSPSGEALDVAEFAMKRRQTWYFHHAALESSPVLRRLTVNGDMNDYISRQAAINLKNNGIYAVESTEDKGRVAWKFEYLVDDRISPETGKIIYGEKRVTPLSFVCNPEMLTVEHGKKIKLIHYVKKSVTPKLQSFKIGPLAPHPRITIDSYKPVPHNVEKTNEIVASSEPPDTNSSHTNNPRARNRSKSPLSEDNSYVHLARCSLDYSRGNDVVVVPATLEKQNHIRSRSQPQSPRDDLNDNTNPPRFHPQTDNRATAVVGLGQRIVPPSVMYAWFPPYSSSHAGLEPGGPPPPRRVVRGDDQKGYNPRS